MFASANIHEFTTAPDHLHAFRITCKVTREDMTAMSEHMLAVFEAAPGPVDMLLSFQTDETSEFGSGLSLDSLKAQLQSLAKVRHYVVANAPGAAGGLVEAMGSILPVEAASFEDEAQAMTWLEAQPAP